MHDFRRHVLASALLGGLLAGCGGDGTSPPSVDAVLVTPGSVVLEELLETQPFSAQAIDAEGNTVQGMSVEWRSTNTSVATVSGSGLATARGEGTAEIQATVGGVTGAATLEVSLPQACTEGELVQLNVGQTWTSTPSGQSCGFYLPAGSAGDRYRIAVLRTSQSADSNNVATVTVEVTGDGVTASPSLATWAGGAAGVEPLAGSARVGALVRSDRARNLRHESLRNEESALLARIGADGLLPSVPAVFRAPAAVTLPPKLQIDPGTPSTCEATTKVTAVKIAEDDRLAVYQDSAQNKTAAAVSVSQAQQLLDFYRDYGKPVIDGYFGGVTDIDENGKVVVFVSPVVSENTAAFVWSGDFFDVADCPASNEMEIIYMAAATVEDLGSPDNLSQALETLVHEMKHVSSLYQRLQRSRDLQSNQYHPLFIEEGVAEIAAEMASRLAWADQGGPAANAMVVEDDIRGTGVTNENIGVVIKLLRTQQYLSNQPNGVVINPKGGGGSVYGSGWLFHRWLGDSFGGAASAPLADSAFFRVMNESTHPSGIDGLTSMTGRSWSQLLEEYATALMTNGRPVTPGPRSFKLYDFVSAIELFCAAVDPKDWEGSGCDTGSTNPGPPGAFPWPVTVDAQGVSEAKSFSTATFSGPAGGSGIRVHELVSNGSGSGAEVQVTVPSPARVVVVRVN